MALKDWSEKSNEYVIVYQHKTMKKHRNVSHLDQIQIFFPTESKNYYHMIIDTINKRTGRSERRNKKFKTELQALKFAKSFMVKN